MGRIADPTEIALAVLWLLSPEASYTTEQRCAFPAASRFSTGDRPLVGLLAPSTACATNST